MTISSILIAILFTGCILTNIKKATVTENALLLPLQGFATFKAKVVKPDEPTKTRVRMELQVLEVNGEDSVARRKIKILAIYDPEKLKDDMTHFRPGQIISFPGIILPTSSAANPWEFDYKRYLNLNGISTVVLIPSPGKISVDSDGKQGIPERFISNIRENLKNVISKSIPSPESNLMLGILLGKRKELPDELETAFRRSGTIHILAASGLHVSIVIAFFILLFKKLKFKKTAIHLLTIIPVLFYALLAGGSPSIVRASIMGVLFLFAGAVEKEYNPLRALFFSAFVLLLINPYNLFNISFQMSFSAVAGIIILYPFFISLLPSKTALRKTLEEKLPTKAAVTISNALYFLVITVVISISAQLALLPILAYYFNEISLVNLPANLILIPLTSVILPLGFMGGFIGMLYYPLGKFILVYSFIPLKIAISTATLLGGSPFASFTAPSPTPVFIILYYSFLLVFGLNFSLLTRNRKTTVLVLLVIAAIYTIFSTYESKKEQKIIVFDTQHSITVFINHKNRTIMTVRLQGKTGNRALKEIQWKAVSFLKKEGISKVDVLVISCMENNNPLILKNITEIIPARKLFISKSSCNKNNPNLLLSAVLSSEDIIPIDDHDYEIEIKDAKISMKKSGSVTYKWDSGQMIIPDIENQYLKDLYRSDELLNNIILITETLPSDMKLIERMQNRSGEDAYIINSSNLSVIKIRNLKKFSSRNNNKTGIGKQLISNGAIIFDVSSFKIHQVNSDKKNQEK